MRSTPRCRRRLVAGSFRILLHHAIHVPPRPEKNRLTRPHPIRSSREPASSYVGWVNLHCDNFVNGIELLQLLIDGAIGANPGALLRSLHAYTVHPPTDALLAPMLRH